MNPWDTRYGSSEEYYYGTEPNDFLKSQTKLFTPCGEILCLAEGEGRNAVFLASLGFKVTAVDGSSVGFTKLERLAKQKLVNGKPISVTQIVSDLEHYPIESESWDGIVSIWCHLPRELRKRVHRAVVTGLRPGGVLILESYRPKQLEFKTGGPPDPNLLMNLHELREEFLGLELVLGQEIEREIHEGKGHFGRSAVVQIVGKKATQ